MFKRAHSTKPGTRITGSARKKLISSINQEIAAQALPPSISISRAYTHLKEQISIYYDDQPNPIYFQAESRLVPTIYTLLEHPRLLPILETNSVVLDKLTNGADLMRPGLLRTDLQKITHLKKNDLVAISSAGHGIWAVGSLAADVLDLLDSETGKAVITLHTRNDFLWNSGSKKIPAPSAGGDDTHQPELEPKDANLDTQPESELESKDEKQELKPTPDQMDKYLISALKTSIIRGKIDQSKLPIPISLFYSDYILPYRPIDCPKLYGVKDSTFKNLSKWIKFLARNDYLGFKEDRKGEGVIVSVNRIHPELGKFSMSKTIYDQEKLDTKNRLLLEQSQQTTDQLKEDASSSWISDWNIPTTEITELYKVKSNEDGILEWIELTKLKSDELYKLNQIKESLNEYLDRHLKTNQGTVKTLNRNLITPDPILLKAIPGLSVHKPVTRPFLLDSLLVNGFEKWWKFEQNQALLILKKGDQIPKVTLKMKKKSGNKLTTLISGVEVFGIDPIRLSKELKILCAGSTTINPIPPDHPLHKLFTHKEINSLLAAHHAQLHHHPGASNSNGFVQVLCQGDHRKFIQDLLVAKFLIHKNFIDLI
ncbi:hypothetical protein Pst134EB_030144 [Puccinia striiformis f. sp. tritici]|nr:hypothetical protein Pst134EB_030144 [Puccinia striiformis f. sp. tritici]